MPARVSFERWIQELIEAVQSNSRQTSRDFVPVEDLSVFLGSGLLLLAFTFFTTGAFFVKLGVFLVVVEVAFEILADFLTVVVLLVGVRLVAFAIWCLLFLLKFYRKSA